MSLKKYIAETERSYTYRLKTIVPLDDYAMDRVERECMQYQPIDISRPRKTMLQANPLDFTNVEASEVWIVDLVLGMPASYQVLGQALRLALGVPENHVIVRTVNDPTEIESDRLNAAREIGAEAAEDGLTPQGLLTDPTYSEVTPVEGLYGKVHNQQFLDALRAVEKERLAKQKIDAPNPLFSWMDMPDATPTDNGEYNADIADGTMLGNAENAPKGNINGVSNVGNLMDRKRTYKRLYGKDGTRTMLTREVDTKKDPK